jgi:pyridinium-3,5-biscarboxylic acid mononucleotide sulfurtransferase
MSDKLSRLRDEIRSKGKVLVLFSGGLDSTLLARLAHDVLKENARALTFHSPIINRMEAEEARATAELIGIPCEVIAINEMEEDPAFSGNPPERCYLCRKIRNRIARRYADEKRIDVVADGLNASDLGDYRPGIRASREDGVWQPFAEFHITKEEIREISRELGLPAWDRPNTVCLCSRLPFGTEITEEKLRRIEAAETFLKSLGFLVCRARSFPLGTAVVEVDDISMAIEHKDLIVTSLRELGFLFVTLDLEGFASGKLNRTVRPEGG